MKNDSFENNIKFYDESVTEEDIVRAAKMANIYDLIESSPQGFKTIKLFGKKHCIYWKE